MSITPELDTLPPESLMIAESVVFPMFSKSIPGSTRMYSLELRGTVPLNSQVVLPSQDPPMSAQTLPTLGFVELRTYSITSLTVMATLPLLALLFESPPYEAVRRTVPPGAAPTNVAEQLPDESVHRPYGVKVPVLFGGDPNVTTPLG